MIGLPPRVDTSEGVGLPLLVIITPVSEEVVTGLGVVEGVVEGVVGFEVVVGGTGFEVVVGGAGGELGDFEDVVGGAGGELGGLDVTVESVVLMELVLDGLVPPHLKLIAPRVNAKSNGLVFVLSIL